MSDSMVLSEKEAFSHIDHTALKADTAWEEIETLCKEALHYHGVRLHSGVLCQTGGGKFSGIKHLYGHWFSTGA